MSTAVAFVPRRDGRFEYAHDAIAHVERTSCAKGCVRAWQDGPDKVAEFGPGGTCGVLARVGLGDGEPVPELLDDGRRVVCEARWPLGPEQGPPPPQTETLW